MAALPPAPNVLKVALQWAIGTDATCFNILHYQYQGAQPVAADCAAMATRILGAYGTSIASQTPPSTILQTATVTDLASNTGFSGTATSAHPGTSVGIQCPARTSFVVGYTIQARYRGGHPRTYFPAMTSNKLQTAQSWTPAEATTYMTGLQALLDSLKGFAAGATTVQSQVVVSYYKGSEWKQDQHGNYHRISTLRPSPLSFVLSTGIPRLRVGTQRKRG